MICFRRSPFDHGAVPLLAGAQRVFRLAMLSNVDKAQHDTLDAVIHGAVGAYPAPMLEFIFETTRTVTQMMLSAMLERHPTVRVLVPHAGACLGALAGRIQLLKDAGPTPQSAAPPDIRQALGRLHYDMAGAQVPEALEALLHMVQPDHLHYGSDWPFTPVAACRPFLDKLIETSLLTQDQRAAMLGGNARRLLSLPDGRSELSRHELEKHELRG